MQHDHTAAADWLALFITACDDDTGEGMTEQQLRDEVITFIGAGVETSAQALSWTWYLLASYPRWLIGYGRNCKRFWGHAPPPPDLPHLSYCRMVLGKSCVCIRLPPSVPRQANAADVLGGYVIPKNAVILMSQYVTHRHPDFWSEPERFCPERFTHPRSLPDIALPIFRLAKGRVCVLGKRLR